uniref:Uncharacterized protein n=1 Tax=Magallana gigas TaxID=29159 RepID=A0A8W8MN83_MAGGI
MERRAGEMIEKFADENMTNESKKAFRNEMRESSLIEKCNSGAFDLLTASNGLSPGHFFESCAEKMDADRMKRKDQARLPESKEQDYN